MGKEINDWINWIQYDELIEGENNCPHKILGIHKVEDGFIYTAFRPDATEIVISDVKGKNAYVMDRINDRGFFGVYVKTSEYSNYLLHIKYLDKEVEIVYDPYSFESMISEKDLDLFAKGMHYEIYEKLGAHEAVVNEVEGTYFAVWAPNARRVSVVGDFNLWDGRVHPMRILGTSGVHELFIPGVKAGELYKFQIKTRYGEILYKADPYANLAELRPNTASEVVNLNRFLWTDQKWIQTRSRRNRLQSRKQPISIYEMHLGSWRKKDDGSEDGYYNYKEIAHELAEYLLEMGYTHVELMGIAEYPFDGSWGYQVTGYYAPTRRYGKPEDFMYFIDYLHNKGIYVILDWVPAHFPKDAHGLARFDGVPLYEHADPRRGEHPHWGTYIFDYGKKEVENFLLANALFWIEKYHIDGLRVDAVASMLYLDYGKEPGEWLPNCDGGRENKEAIVFFQHMNRILEERVPGAFMIAEESTSWEGVTAPVVFEGLGFLLKWNMGWMNDFLEYMKLDPYFRQFNHAKITFGMMYAYSENFIQVLSHDEVVHGKGSMIGKMPGEYNDKFANLRVAYGFMYGHPGKKLLFMGQEFAQWREWSEARSLDWELLSTERNYQMQQYVKQLNHLYQKYEAFYSHDYDAKGFEWVNCQDAKSSIISFIRHSDTKKEQLLIICNFTPVWKDDYRVGVPCEGEYTEILNSDALAYGGYGVCNQEPLEACEGEWDGRDYYISFKLPPLSTVIFIYDYIEKKQISIKNK